MATTKYAEWVKEALIAEVKTRRAANRNISVDLRANEDVLRQALDADDINNGEFNGGDEKEEKEDEEKPLLRAPIIPQNGGPPRPPVLDATKAPPKPFNIRRQLAPVPEAVGSSAIPESAWDDAKHYLHKKDGLTYEVIKTPADFHNKPVKARVPAQESDDEDVEGHPGLFWSGTEAEFAADFEKI